MALIEKQFAPDIKITEAKKVQQVQYDMPCPHQDEEAIELDVIEQLRANIARLHDLQNRLRHLNSEISSILIHKK